MAKLSQTVKEIIKTVIFVLVVGTLLTAFVCYPLNRTKAFMARSDVEDYVEDSLVVNDAQIYTDAGLLPDTFRVEADGLTNLACIYLTPTDTADSIKGTVALLHPDGADRDSLVGLSQVLLQAGYNVIVYDQRATSRTTGKYHGEGRFEASDLVELIRYLDMRERIIHPLCAIGFDRGGDAALLAAIEDNRIDGVVAINPYLSSKRLLDHLRDKHKPYWTPLYRTMTWWWYNIRSGYSAPYRDPENIEPVACRTLLTLTAEGLESEEAARIKEISEPERLTLETTPASESEFTSRIILFLQQQ